MCVGSSSSVQWRYSHFAIDRLFMLAKEAFEDWTDHARDPLRHVHTHTLLVTGCDWPPCLPVSSGWTFLPAPGLTAAFLRLPIAAVGQSKRQTNEAGR